MEVSYNVIDEKWIPCLMADGSFQELSVLEVFEEAAHIQRIEAEYPPMTAAIHMFLMAILYRALNIQTMDDWAENREAGAFNMSRIRDYLDRFHDRFDLFDEVHPFYQDPKIGQRPKDIKLLKGKIPEPKTINGLILHSAAGDNATLFDHKEEEQFLLTLDSAARHLLMLQGFSLGGMTSASISADKFYRDSPNPRGAVILLGGNTLFETLLLNIIALEEIPEETGQTGQDCPSWELEDPFASESDIPDGIMAFLTWQSRRIKLIPENNRENGSVTINEVYAAPGRAINEAYLNPFYAYIFKDNKKIPVKFSETRALWRDSVSLLESTERAMQSRPPIAVNWTYALKGERFIEKFVMLNAFGMCTSPGKKKAFFYRQESFFYPAAYLDNADLLSELRLKMGLADKVAGALNASVFRAAQSFLSPEEDLAEGRKPDPKDVRALADHWNITQIYWSGIEPAFRDLLNQIPNDINRAEQDWQKQLNRKAIQALEYLESIAGTSVKSLKATSKARRKLNYELGLIFTPDTTKEENK